MPLINKFNTQLDLARQAKILSGETACFDGGITIGIPFSGFPSGVDETTIVSLGASATERATFSGSSATTVFDVSNLLSPLYDPTHPTIRQFPYSEIDNDTAIETVSATTYSPLLLSYTANTGINDDPTNLIWGNPVLENLYNINDSGTTYPNNLFIELFETIGEGIVGNTIELTETEFYQTESSNSIYSGATFNMTIYEQGVHGSNPALVTGTTSGTVTEYSATTFTWENPIHLNETSGLTLPITTSNTDTQTTPIDWVVSQTIEIDGNIVPIQFTGFSVTYSFDTVADVSSGGTSEYHGLVFATVENFVAGSNAYTGSTTWLNVRGSGVIDDDATVGRLTIEELYTGTAVTSLAIDTNGNVVSGGSLDIFVSGSSFNPSTYDLTIGRNDGTDFITNLGVLSNDVFVTGGTYDINTGIVTYTNTSGVTFEISGFTSGMTDSYTTGATLTANTLSFDNNIYGNDFYSVDLTPLVFSGGSGNCITDLYVTNVHSCASVITVHDNIQNVTSTATGNYVNVFGSGNTSTENYTFIGGGVGNSIYTLATYNSIVGGTNNNMNNRVYNSFIGGGKYNLMTQAGTTYSAIVGGSGNTITGSGYAIIGGGQNNLIDGGSYSSILGGRVNSLQSNSSSILGGGGNIIDSIPTYSTIGGGYGNVMTGGTTYIDTGRFIGGGFYNKILGQKTSSTVIGGGYKNYITNGIRGVIGGGAENTLNGDESVIAGGYRNTIDNSGGGITSKSFIGGGESNTISGNSIHSVIVGGQNNVLDGGYKGGIFGGQNNNLTHNESFIIGSNITSISANTTHVEKLNIGTLNGTPAVTSLALDANGMVVSGGSLDTFFTGITFSNNELTITRNDAFTDSIFINELSGLTINGDLNVTGDTTLNGVTATTIDGTTILSGGTDLISIIDSRDNFTTGSTLIGDTIYFNTIDTLSAYTLSLSSLDVNDTFVTGGTFNDTTDTITFTDNDGGTFNVTGITDTFVTGTSFNSSILTIGRNDGTNFNVTIDELTGLTINGDLNVTGDTIVNNLTANTVDATTILSGGTDLMSIVDSRDNFTTGTTVIGSTIYFDTTDTLSAYTADLSAFEASLTADTFFTDISLNNNELTITRNDAFTDSIFINELTGLTINGNLTVTGDTTLNGVTATTLDSTTILSGGTDLISIIDSRDNFTTGSTLIGSTAYFNTIDNLSAYTLDLSSLDVNDTFVTGGTFNDTTDTITFTNNGAGTFNVTGITDTFVTGTSFNSSILTIGRNDGTNFTAQFTGNTSGECITDLYVTNLYGCSPITVHDNFQNVTSSASGFYSNSFGKNNTVSSDYSSIGGGSGNTINTGGTYSSIIGGSGNIVTHSNSHILGSNITSVSADTTHVERLNIGTVDSGSVADKLLVITDNGIIKSIESTGAKFGNTYFVAPEGDDLTGVRGDITRPFQTVSGARDKAVSEITGSTVTGDTLVYVFPGTYIDDEMQYDNGNFYFTPGSHVKSIQRLHVDRTAMFRIGDLPLHIAPIYSASTCNVFGEGKFTLQVDLDNDWAGAVVQLRASGSSYFECHSIVVEKGTGMSAIHNAQGTFKGDFITVGEGYCATARDYSDTVFNFNRIRVDGGGDAFFLRHTSFSNGYFGKCVVDAEEISAGGGRTAVLFQRLRPGAEVIINADKIISDSYYAVRSSQGTGGDVRINGNMFATNGFRSVSDTGSNFSINGDMEVTAIGVLMEASNTVDHKLYFNGDIVVLSGATNAVNLDDGTLRLNGSIENQDISGTGTTFNGIDMSGGKLIIDTLKVITDNESITALSPLNMKVIHSLASNKPVNANMTNLITGSNIIIDSDVE